MALQITERTESTGFKFKGAHHTLQGTWTVKEGEGTHVTVSIHDSEDNRYLGSVIESLNGEFSLTTVSTESAINVISEFNEAKAEILKEINHK